jgi:cysteine synthase B
MTILDSIGNTPLVEIKKIWKSNRVRIFAKVEGMNPGGSIKDRVALNMIQQAINRGDLKPGMEVIEATSGNTGIGLAMVCAALGYKCTLVMPDSVSRERYQLCKAYGANVESVTGNTDDAIKLVNYWKTWKKLETGEYIFYNPNQFDNPDNWKTHWLYTGPEISGQLHSIARTKQVPNPNVFVASCGTTGTIRGCGAWFNYNYKQLIKLNL